MVGHNTKIFPIWDRFHKALALSPESLAGSGDLLFRLFRVRDHTIAGKRRNKAKWGL